MSRTFIPARRESVTQHLSIDLITTDRKVLVTYGIHEGRVVEMFCADFKAGTAMHTLVTDACVMASLLLQHGYTARTLFERLAEGPSLIGQLVACAVEIETRQGTEGEPT